jgi:hypothetical protein
MGFDFAGQSTFAGLSSNVIVTVPGNRAVP